MVSQVASRYKLGMRTLLLLALSLFLIACQATDTGKTPWMQTPDTHSFSRPAEVRSTHLELVLNLDFEQKIATGSVTHHLLRTDPMAPFVVDTSDLSILSVTDQTGAELTFTLAEDAGEWRGRPLSIDLGAATKTVKIHYQTSPQAEAMQWLAPEQTSGKEQPFLFTQGQATRMLAAFEQMRLGVPVV